MRTSKGGTLKAMLTKAETKRAAIDADDNPWGTPIDYRHLSDQQLTEEYERLIETIPTGDDLKDLESLDVQALIQIYTGLLS
jgi:hypothetical protein